MDFISEIERLEKTDAESVCIEKIGNKKVLFTAPHTMLQKRSDGTYKYREPYTKAIAMYLAQNLEASYLVKIKDTGVDANREESEELKKRMLEIIKQEDIKLLIDIHGAKRERDFDVELGTLDGKTIEDNKIEKLIEVFNKNGINNIKQNDPFKGGAITQIAYENGIEVLQIEINSNYRDTRMPEKLESFCKSLIEFINEIL